MAENPRIEELRRRVQADPASIAFAALAEEFRRVGRYDDAIETCRTGLNRHPAYLSARVTLGRALIETGDFAGAREELQTVLQSAPENIAALRGLQQINERLGHSTEMHPDLAALANEPIRLTPTPPEPPAPVPTPAPATDFSSYEPAAPVSPGAFDLQLSSSDEREAEPQASEPFDIFAAALQRTGAAPEPPPMSVELPPIAVEPQPMAFDPQPMAFESATIAFEAPVITPQPDPHVAAALVRLERFLGAIHTARHA